jgi:hypothetical protein
MISVLSVKKINLKIIKSVLEIPNGTDIMAPRLLAAWF